MKKIEKLNSKRCHEIFKEVREHCKELLGYDKTTVYLK